MLSIEEIRKPIITELQIFNEKFAQSLTTHNQLLNEIHTHILNNSGKQLRPVLVLLSAKLCGTVNNTTYNCALSVELFHNASLIHDDVVDDTVERRGRKSVNSRWTNKIAVLAGDYMLSNALAKVIESGNLDVLREIAQIGLELSDGELVQIANTDKIEITEEDYFSIINKKTAVLFSVCCTVGAISVGAKREQVETLKEFGKKLGLCFQIKDDIFDYFSDIKIGKPTGNDLQDGKITLPLIYALAQVSEEEKKDIYAIIKSKNFTSENIKYVMDFARGKNGIEYAEQKMESIKNEAISLLDSFPNGEIKTTLAKCVDFAVERRM